MRYSRAAIRTFSELTCVDRLTTMELSAADASDLFVLARTVSDEEAVLAVAAFVLASAVRDESATVRLESALDLVTFSTLVTTLIELAVLDTRTVKLELAVLATTAVLLATLAIELIALVALIELSPSERRLSKLAAWLASVRICGEACPWGYVVTAIGHSLPYV